MKMKKNNSQSIRNLKEKKIASIGDYELSILKLQSIHLHACHEWSAEMYYTEDSDETIESRFLLLDLAAIRHICSEDSWTYPLIKSLIFSNLLDAKRIVTNWSADCLIIDGKTFSLNQKQMAVVPPNTLKNLNLPSCLLNVNANFEVSGCYCYELESILSRQDVICLDVVNSINKYGQNN